MLGRSHRRSRDSSSPYLRRMSAAVQEASRTVTSVRCLVTFKHGYLRSGTLVGDPSKQAGISPDNRPLGKPFPCCSVTADTSWLIVPTTCCSKRLAYCSSDPKEPGWYYSCGAAGRTEPGTVVRRLGNWHIGPRRKQRGQARPRGRKYGNSHAVLGLWRRESKNVKAGF